MMDVTEIASILPHRYPFLLVDRIVEMELSRRIVGIKNVTMNEPYFQGHFPGFPIMPGVLIIESMAQVAGVLAFKSSPNEHAGKLVYFIGIDRAKFRKPVLPGDQLRMEIEILQERSPFWKMKGVAFVEGKVVAEAILSAMLGERKERK
ncbi:MAG TPA: 3-hydroxyacyl-ACP dehydratase FabZ [Nitrospiria bacterium]|nr:3-hydroxyacyl-ACP dehydratase FabZ [Nitrospiria bacterium]